MPQPAFWEFEGGLLRTRLWQDDGDFGMKRGTQLELALPRATAAERKARIRDRLVGYELRQRVREAKRRASAQRRKLAGTQAPSPSPREAQQLPIPKISPG